MMPAAKKGTSRGAPPISFSFIHGTSLVVIPAFVNERGPYRFLLDTGASHSALSIDVADQLNIPTRGTGSLITAGGSVPVTIRTIEVFRMGEIRIMQAQIAVADFDLLRTLQVDGIVGSDYLKRFRIAIDYTRQVLIIKD